LNEVLDRFRNTLVRGYTLKKYGLPPRTTNAQIKASWARSVKPQDQIPELFRDFFESAKSTEQDFPYTVITPTYDGFIHRQVEKLICNFQHAVVVLEKSGNSYLQKCYPLDRISYVQLETHLLDSSFRIFGVTEDGTPSSSAFRYNTVTDYLFFPILYKIRHTADDSSRSADLEELGKFNSWGQDNPKFMNFAKRSLLPGECVIQAILSPEIRQDMIKIFGMTYDIVVSPTLAAILTDQELIMIREVKNRCGPGNYGGIWEYISLQNIAKLSTLEVIDNIMMFSIQLTDGRQLEYLFQAGVNPEILRLQNSFRRIRSLSRSA
jgi:hypothetical protein